MKTNPYFKSATANHGAHISRFDAASWIMLGRKMKNRRVVRVNHPGVKAYLILLRNELIATIVLY